MMKNSPFLTGLSFLGAAFLFGAPIVSAQQPSPPMEQQENRPVEKALQDRPLPAKAKASLPSIYLEGDSTVKVGTAGERGWGDELAAFFDANKINVVNHAIGGRSSRTFQTEGRWDKSLAMAQKGDFIIFQFGHNDGGQINDNSRARATLKGNGEETQEIDNMLTHQHEVVHTYGWYMRKYIRDAKAKGAIPIVCSLIPRQNWKDGKIGRASDSYGKWAREAAEQEGALFVDLNEIIAQGYEKMGPEKVAPLFKEGPHTTPEGAKFNAECVVAGLKGLPGKPLTAYLSDAAKDIPPFDSSKK
jgi:rhamnogalacturonan acetylesterase